MLYKTFYILLSDFLNLPLFALQVTWWCPHIPLATQLQQNLMPSPRRRLAAPFLSRSSPPTSGFPSTSTLTELLMDMTPQGNATVPTHISTLEVTRVSLPLSRPPHHLLHHQHLLSSLRKVFSRTRKADGLSSLQAT